VIGPPPDRLPLPRFRGSLSGPGSGRYGASPRLFEPLLDRLKQTVEPVDGLIVAKPNRNGNPIDEKPYRSRTVECDEVLRLVRRDGLAFHEPSLAIPADQAIA